MLRRTADVRNVIGGSEKIATLRSVDGIVVVVVRQTGAPWHAVALMRWIPAAGHNIVIIIVVVVGAVGCTFRCGYGNREWCCVW